ncbi:DNA polymerase III subunit delta' [Almyronema epifaneia]|uniref:DNA polymerase III subunit delta n=1 Tax=Almyronema epifaneia S1 TaxID=2991925 RepID=A0ABW6IFQ3_9CYAN
MVSAAFVSLIGQSQAIELLESAVAQQHVAPAYLFVGPEGVGRSLAASAWAEQLLSPTKSPSSLRHRIQQRNHPDLLWVEPTYLHQGKRLTATEAMDIGLRRKSPPQIRLEQVREISRYLSRPPLEAERAVVVIEQAETMAESAANGLLKTLEEPGRATLILLAPDRSALLPTLVSRCQQVAFRRLSAAEMQQVLTQSGQAEILAHPEILAIAQGSPGQAIASWQQRQAIPAELLQALRQPPATLRQALEQARHIAKTLEIETQLWLVDYLQHQYWQVSTTASIPYLQQLEQARQHLLGFVQPRLVWEVTLMQLVRS